MAERNNSIDLFKQYITLLDEVYQAESLTSALDGNNELAQMSYNSGEMKIPKISMDGLGDYSRTTGYPKGTVNLEFETKKCNYDRGRVFSVNEMDNVESAGIAFGMLSSEFIRTKVVPELDAFRLSKYAGLATNKVAAALSGGTEWISALSTAKTTMDNAEVPTNDRHLFITSDGIAAINDLDTTKSRAVLDSFATITMVPTGRFYDAIDLNDGTTSGKESGGFAKASTGKAINFEVVSRSALIQYTKNIVNKIISPEENQEDDRWKFFYHAYGIADVYDNKKAGIYVHTEAPA